VRELETVLRTGSRAIEALSLMATCKLSLGDAEAAAAHLEDALERAGDSDESSVSLRYDWPRRCSRRAARRRRSKHPEGLGRGSRIPRRRERIARFG